LAKALAKILWKCSSSLLTSSSQPQQAVILPQHSHPYLNIKSIVENLKQPQPPPSPPPYRQLHPLQPVRTCQITPEISTTLPVLYNPLSSPVNRDNFDIKI
jgi:hypothetical protein